MFYFYSAAQNCGTHHSNYTSIEKSIWLHICLYHRDVNTCDSKESKLMTAQRLSAEMIIVVSSDQPSHVRLAAFLCVIYCDWTWGPLNLPAYEQRIIFPINVCNQVLIADFRRSKRGKKTIVAFSIIFHVKNDAFSCWESLTWTKTLDFFFPA